MSNKTSIFDKLNTDPLVFKLKERVEIPTKEILHIGKMTVLSKKRADIKKATFVLTKSTLFYVKGEIEEEDSITYFKSKAKIELSWVKVSFFQDVIFLNEEQPFILYLEKNKKRVSFKIHTELEFQEFKQKFKGIGIKANFLDEFKVVSTVNQGSSATVYKVRQIEDGMIFACKRIKKSFLTSSDYFQVVVNEIRVLRKLNRQRRFTQLIDVYESENSVYLLMEYCEGGRVTQQKQVLSYRELMTLARFLFKAVRDLKSLGIVHRDLKPDNILLKHKNISLEQNKIKICDFGLSFFENENPHLLSSGTYCYMAPEVILNKASIPTYKYDVFSIGIILYNAITGRKSVLTKERVFELKSDEESLVDRNHFSMQYSQEQGDRLERMLKRILHLDSQERATVEYLQNSFVFNKDEKEVDSLTNTTNLNEKYSFKTKALKKKSNNTITSKFSIFSENVSEEDIQNGRHSLDQNKMASISVLNIEPKRNPNHRYSEKRDKESSNFLTVSGEKKPKRFRSFTVKKSLFFPQDN